MSDTQNAPIAPGGAPAAPLPKSGMAIASLVLGIVAAVTSFLPIINNLSFILAVLAVIFGIVGVVAASRGKRAGRGLALAGIVVAVVAGAVVLGTQALYSAAIDKVQAETDAAFDQAKAEADANLDRMTGDATDQVLAEEVDVQIGAFAATEDKYGLADTGLPVTLTNKSDQTATFNIHIEAVGSDGGRIDDGYAMANDLRPGQSQDFELFTFVPSDKLEAMKGATFEIVEASAY